MSLEAQYEVEYCIVDDGSTDSTPALIGSSAPDGARCTVISHLKNLGIGAAFRTGFAHMDADIVCTMDADCSYAPSEMRRLLAVIARDEADVVVASPYHPEGAVEGVQFWRLLLSLNCSLLYRVATPLKLHTYTSIFRAYRGSALKTIVFPSDGFVSAVEILLNAASQGYRIAEVPATLTKRVAGTSKMRLLRTIQAHVKLISRCCAARVSGRYPQFAAALGSVASTEVSIAQVRRSGQYQRKPPMPARGVLRTELAHVQTDSMKTPRAAQA